MKAIKILTLIGFFAAAGSAAMAADLSRVFLSSSPMMRDNKEGSLGWYLRGDVGYVGYKRTEMDFAAQPFTSDLNQESLKPTAVAGAGLGYRFNPNVRVDLTLDHAFDARLKGTGPAPNLPTASTTDKGLFQSTTLMVNGYLDFRSVMGLTPYIGAGIGVAHNVLSDHVLAIYDPVTGAEMSERFAGGEDFGLAWALMAGVGYQLSSNFTLDLGYRFVSFGDVKTHSYDNGTGVDVGSIGAHEVRLGLRYNFN